MGHTIHGVCGLDLDSIIRDIIYMCALFVALQQYYDMLDDKGMLSAFDVTAEVVLVSLVSVYCCTPIRVLRYGAVLIIVERLSDVSSLPYCSTIRLCNVVPSTCTPCCRTYFQNKATKAFKTCMYAYLIVPNTTYLILGYIRVPGTTSTVPFFCVQ